jgi:serine O-acetyltransferase
VNFNSLFSRLAYLQRRRGIGPLVSVLLRARGTFIPPSTLVGERIRLLHTGHGIVIDDRTVIHDGVWIFQNVTVGRARPWMPREAETGRVVLEPHVMLCAGSVVAVPPEEELRVGTGTVVGANSVLTVSTGEWEVWAGVPARRIGSRPRPGG